MGSSGAPGDGSRSWGVRPATPEDGALLDRLGAESSREAGERVFVIEVEGQPVGFLALEPARRAVTVREIRLLPAWRERGIEADGRITAPG